MKKAIIYLRVSDPKQVEGTSLESQESVSRSYCGSQNYQVIDVDRQEGISAKGSNVQRILELMDYCKERKGKFEVLVVFKLSRFARNQQQHHWLRKKLLDMGIILRSATEPIDEIGVGKMLEGVLASVNEFDNEVRAEVSRLGMIRRLEQGLWPWNPPDGYYLPKEADVKLSVCKLDLLCCEQIREALIMFSSGNYSYQSIANHLNKQNLRNRKGNKIHFYPQKVQYFLKNPFYCGFTYSTLDQTTRKGKHEPLIDMETWNKIQAIINKNPRKGMVKKWYNPDFPLRGLILDKYEKPMTGAWSTSHTGQRYAYYFSQSRESGFNRADQIHTAFVELLKTIQPKEEVVSLFMAMFEEDITKRREQRTEEINMATIKINEVKTKLKKLLDIRIDEEIDPVTFKTKQSELLQEQLTYEQQINLITDDKIPWDEIIDFSKKYFIGIPSKWQKMDMDGKKQLQGSIFKEKPIWLGDKYRTPKLQDIFYAFEAIDRSVSTTANFNFLQLPQNVPLIGYSTNLFNQYLFNNYNQSQYLFASS